MAKIGSAKLYITIGIFLVIFLPPFAKYQELRYKNRKLEEKMILMKAENQDLEIKKKRLETDVTYIERKAREKIGLVRKGEIVLKEVPKK